MLHIIAYCVNNDITISLNKITFEFVLDSIVEFGYKYINQFNIVNNVII